MNADSMLIRIHSPGLLALVYTSATPNFSPMSLQALLASRLERNPLLSLSTMSNTFLHTEQTAYFVYIELPVLKLHSAILTIGTTFY